MFCISNEGLLLDFWHSYLDDKWKKKKVTHGGPSYNFYTNANSVLKIIHSFCKGSALTVSRVHFLLSQPGDKAMGAGGTDWMGRGVLQSTVNDAHSLTV